MSQAVIQKHDYPPPPTTLHVVVCLFLGFFLILKLVQTRLEGACINSCRRRSPSRSSSAWRATRETRPLSSSAAKRIFAIGIWNLSYTLATKVQSNDLEVAMTLQVAQAFAAVHFVSFSHSLLTFFSITVFSISFIVATIPHTIFHNFHIFLSANLFPATADVDFRWNQKYCVGIYLVHINVLGVGMYVCACVCVCVCARLCVHVIRNICTYIYMYIYVYYTVYKS